MRRLSRLAEDGPPVQAAPRHAGLTDAHGANRQRRHPCPAMTLPAVGMHPLRDA